MSSAAKFKKQALQHEHDRQYDKALAIYARLLDGPPGAADEEPDVALFNRAGDLALRAGDVARAVTYYERAVDLYAAGGLLNNAIALCNKILRHAPEQVAAHYSLGVLHAKQGFRGDARVHFIEYAERMHRAGNDDEALRALRELAELCAPGDDVRALLASHLARTGRGGGAASSLQSMLDGAGVAAPTPAPARPADVAGAPEPAADRGRDALVFLDLTGAPTADDEADVAAAAPTPVAGLELARLDLEPPGAADPARRDGGALDGGLEVLDGAEPAWVAGAPWGGEPATSHPAALPGELPLLDLAHRHGAVPAAAEPARAALVDDGGALALVELDAAAIAGAVRDATVPAPAGPDAPMAADLDEPLDLASVGLAPLDTGEPELLDVAAPDADAPSAFAGRDADAPAAFAFLDLPDAVADDAGAWGATADRAPADAVDAAAVAPPPSPEAPPAVPPSEFVDLGEWARELEAPRSTRMVTAEAPQSGDEQADFERMLEAFKAGVERNIDDADFDSHYDLGVAFREMGLLDEAATQFQRAARAPGRPLRAVEALGACFVELGRPELALEALGRAAGDEIAEKSAARDEQLVGVLYLLGVASEQTGRTDAAAGFYRRVLAIDLQFRDAARRLAQLPPPPPR